MAELKSDGVHGASIKIDVDVGAEIKGRSTIHLPDGTTTDGPSSQSFVRITKDNVKEGSWLLNPATKETHKVVHVEDGLVLFEGRDRIVSAAVEMIHDLLLLVVNE